MNRLGKPWLELIAYMEIWAELDQIYKIEPDTPDPARVVKEAPR
jgi:hypothetical protein